MSSQGRPDHAGGRGRARWQVGLSTLFLLMAAIAVGITHFINVRQSEELRARIATARPLAHELSIDDPNQMAVVMEDPEWIDDDRWEVYLPAGRYRLCVATREIDDRGLAPVVKSAPIGAGKHRIGIKLLEEGSIWRVAAKWDETGLLEREEPKDWNLNRSWSGGGEYPLSTQLPTTGPLVLERRRFSRQVGKTGSFTTPGVPCEGVLLWIEREPGSNESRAAPKR